jgi:hypothetical protein
MGNAAELVGASCVVIFFTVLIYLLGIIQKTRQTIEISQKAVEIIRDPSISDEQKQQLVQASSLKLFSLLGMLVIFTAVAILIPVGIIWVAELVGLVSLDGVLRLMVRWEFVTAATILGIAVYLALSKWSRRRS